jgi:hypothetical protein
LVNKEIYRVKITMSLWYFAHPATGDDEHTFQENMAHALQMQKLIWNAGLNVVNPWYSLVEVFGPAEGDLLERAIGVDLAIIRHLDGIVLTGHKLSAGMKTELEEAMLHDKGVINLIGLHDHQVANLIAKHAPNL